MRVTVITVCLLIASNVFMTFTWYAHLRKSGNAAVVRGGVDQLGDHFEFLLHVPANPTRVSYPSLTQLKRFLRSPFDCSAVGVGVRMSPLDYMKPRVEHLEGRHVATTVVVEPRPCYNTDDTFVDALPFDLIYDTYAPLLRKIACAKFGISTNDAADLVHDVSPRIS